MFMTVNTVCERVVTVQQASGRHAFFELLFSHYDLLTGALQNVSIEKCPNN
jgi:hypothetical protein